MVFPTLAAGSMATLAGNILPAAISTRIGQQVVGTATKFLYVYQCKPGAFAFAFFTAISWKLFLRAPFLSFHVCSRKTNYLPYNYS